MHQSSSPARPAWPIPSRLGIYSWRLSMLTWTRGPQSTLDSAKIDSEAAIRAACIVTEDSTVKDLQARIIAHFDAHPDLRESPLFIGLFNRTCAATQPNTGTGIQTQPHTHRPSALTTNILNVMQHQPGPSNYYHSPYPTLAQHNHLYYPFIPGTQPSKPSATSTYHDNTLQ